MLAAMFSGRHSLAIDSQGRLDIDILFHWFLHVKFSIRGELLCPPPAVVVVEHSTDRVGGLGFNSQFSQQFGTAAMFLRSSVVQALKSWRWTQPLVTRFGDSACYSKYDEGLIFFIGT